MISETNRNTPSPTHDSPSPAPAYLLALVTGVAVAWFIAPALFLRLPNDRARIGMVVRALRTPRPPRLVVLGNSVAMFGLDARQLAPSAWNLATSAQTLAESALLFDALPEETRNVVLLVTPWHLDLSEPLDAETWNAWWMYGARPTPEVRALLTEACGPATGALLATPAALQRFRSRWIVRAATESMARDALTRDPGRERLAADLHHPASWTAGATESRLAAERGVAPGSEDFRLDSSQRLLLEGMASLARRRGKRLTLLLAPLSPSIRARYSTAAIRSLEAIRVSGVATIDATGALPASSDFIDLTHPSADGASRLGAFVAARLRELR